MNINSFFQKPVISRNDLALKVGYDKNILSTKLETRIYNVMSPMELYALNHDQITEDEYIKRNLNQFYKKENLKIDTFSPKKFAENLNMIMKARCISRASLAEDAKLSVKTINLYLEKKRTPRIDHIISIANALQVNIIELIK